VIRILTPSLVPHDAIGHDVTQMANFLRRRGESVELIAATIDRAYRHVARPLARCGASEWSAPDDLLIYHHSMQWPAGEEVLDSTRNRTVVRYHNITPPEFFAGHSESHRVACQAGRHSTGHIVVSRPDASFWGASFFNCAELVELGAREARCRVLPPFHMIAELTTVQFDFDVLREFRDGSVNVLFVGGVKPNKGHRRAIDVFREYRQRFERRSRLIFAGAFATPFRGYLEGLRAYADESGLGNAVVFRTSVTAEALRTFYTLADVFLCMSEHEGFCVPLVEAMCFRVPIVALGTTAVPETVGNCGVVLAADEDDDVFAASIDACVQRIEFARQLRAAGWRRYTALYRREVLEQRFAQLLAEVRSESAVAGRD
jgi:glycosyltransferase involved in cell wall biosynthesis